MTLVSSGITFFLFSIVFLFFISASTHSVGCSTIAVNGDNVVSNGLRNLGNTCYMNSQLQCAFHIPYIRSLILASDPDDDDGDKKVSPGVHGLRSVFKNMLEESLERKSTSASTDILCRCLGINPMEQQDAQEFWKLFLPQLNLQKLTDLYTGSYEDYIVACDGTGRSRRREEPFLDLSLEVDGFHGVIDSFRKMFNAPELLSVAEGNGWRPPVDINCNKSNKVDALKSQLLHAKGLPTLLQLHLKRFRYDWQTDVTTKLNNKYVFPEELDLSEIIAPCSDIDNAHENGKNEGLPLAKYVLQSVIVHVGQFGSGHYYTYCNPRLGNYNSVKKSKSQGWFRFDDDRVTSVTFEDVIVDAYGGSSTTKFAKQNGKNPSNNKLQERLCRWLSWRQPRVFFGYGGKESCAYMLQYIRKCDLPLIYSHGKQAE